MQFLMGKFVFLRKITLNLSETTFSLKNHRKYRKIYEKEKKERQAIQRTS